MSFKLIAELEGKLNQKENNLLFEDEYQMEGFFSKDGMLVQESVKEFVASGREFIKHGSFPLWNKLNPKEDEDESGKIDDKDRPWYLARVTAGLYRYLKNDLKTVDPEAFKIVLDETGSKSIDDNIKKRVEQDPIAKKWAEKVATTWATDARVKQEVSKYLDAIEKYYVTDQKVTAEELAVDLIIFEKAILTESESFN